MFLWFTRSQWKTHQNRINPDRQYHSCNQLSQTPIFLSLREQLYGQIEEVMSIEKMSEKRTIDHVTSLPKSLCNNFTKRLHKFKSYEKKRLNEFASIEKKLENQAAVSDSSELQKTLSKFIVPNGTNTIDKEIANVLENEVSLPLDTHINGLDIPSPDPQGLEIPQLTTTDSDPPHLSFTTLTHLDDHCPPQTLSTVVSTETTEVLQEPEITFEEVLESIKENVDTADPSFSSIEQSNSMTISSQCTDYENIFEGPLEISEEEANNTLIESFNLDEDETWDANEDPNWNFFDLGNLTGLMMDYFRTTSNMKKIISFSPQLEEVNELVSHDKKEEYAVAIAQKQATLYMELPALTPDNFARIIMNPPIPLPPPPPVKVVQFNVMERKNELVFTEKLFIGNVPTIDKEIIKDAFLSQLSTIDIHNISVSKVEIVTDQIKSTYRQHAILTIAEKGPPEVIVDSDGKVITVPNNFESDFSIKISDILSELSIFGVYIGSSRCDLRSANCYRYLWMQLSPQLLHGDTSQYGIMKKLFEIGVTGIASICVGTNRTGNVSGSILAEFILHNDAQRALDHLQEAIHNYPKPLVKEVSWACNRQRPGTGLPLSKKDLSAMLLISPRSKKMQQITAHIYPKDSEEPESPKKPSSEDLFKIQYQNILSALVATNYDLDRTASNLALQRAQVLTIINDLTRLGFSFNFPPEITWAPGSNVTLGDSEILETDMELLAVEKRDAEKAMRAKELKMGKELPPSIPKRIVIDSPKIDSIRLERGFQPLKRRHRKKSSTESENQLEGVLGDVIMSFPIQQREQEM